MELKREQNIAFVDGQNLYMGTAKKEMDPLKIDLFRFRVYLAQKYKVEKAFYHLGYVNNEHRDLYEQIQSAGFVLVFKEHNIAMAGIKKGNVDSDIIFSAMKRLYRKEDFEKIIVVSGDGDYIQLVDFLIEEGRFEKILFPDRKFRSSLYKKISNKYFAYLDDLDIKNKITKNIQKEKGALGN
jgi:uncharacterized LabA/DUF88 family protein